MSARAAYEADRKWQRAHRATRADQGLPKHPDGTGWAMCPECEGAGEHIENASANGDPQCEYPVPCHRCWGEGEVADGHEDPLLALRRHRYRMRMRLGAVAFASTLYRLDRERAMKRVPLPLDPPPLHPVFAELFTRWGIAA